ncbi:MAG: hypothetical protein KJ560_06095 [Gammaproteobacteria bacterium]|nr:hypothetical protein [Gammaproteobacteria bacterium]MBU2422134.1 hypothetical protein [Gammaproteobacteria bacterium]
MNTHFYIPAHGPDVEALKEVLSAASVLAKHHKCEITLVVPVLGSANSTILSDVIGTAQLKKLVKGETLTLLGNPLKLTSTQKLSPFTSNGVLVGIWAGKNMLKKLDDCHNYKAVVALSWLPDEISTWADSHNAKCISSKENA